MMDNNNTAFWIDLFKSGSVTDLEMSLLSQQQQQQQPINFAVPKNLLHLACEHGADLSLIQYLLDNNNKPPMLAIDEFDDSGYIPLHYVCLRSRRFFTTTRSTSVLSLFHLLLQAAPDTILMRIREDIVNTNDNNGTDDQPVDNDDDDGNNNGILPSILAHNHGAPPTVVQFLLRRQFQAHHGVVVSHSDLAQVMHWNEELFVEYIAKTLQQISPECIQRISFQDCRLTYTVWKMFQAALEDLPHGYLIELRLDHLHIWHTTALPQLEPQPQPQEINANQQTPLPQQQQQQQQHCWRQVDVDIWKRIIEKHKSTLITLELPHFYALTLQSVNFIVHTLAHEQFPFLRVLDARSSDQKQPRRYPTSMNHHQQQQQQSHNTNSNHHRHDRHHHNSNSKKRRGPHPTTIDVGNLGMALRMHPCKLQSLALESLTVSEFQQILSNGLKMNRSVQYLHVASILSDNASNSQEDDDADLDIPWTTLQTALMETLQCNVALERIVGPRPLIHSRPLQLYLQLNRQYHRRDIGHWSPTLVAHVLAKTLLQQQQQQQQQETSGGDDNSSSFYFPTNEPIPDHDPKSTIYYILKSRPDILKSKQ